MMRQKPIQAGEYHIRHAIYARAIVGVAVLVTEIPYEIELGPSMPRDEACKPTSL
jgi:hypothetical protein